MPRRTRRGLASLASRLAIFGLLLALFCPACANVDEADPQSADGDSQEMDNSEDPTPDGDLGDDDFAVQIHACGTGSGDGNPASVITFNFRGFSRLETVKQLLIE